MASVELHSDVLPLIYCHLDWQDFYWVKLVCHVWHKVLHNFITIQDTYNRSFSENLIAKHNLIGNIGLIQKSTDLWTTCDLKLSFFNIYYKERGMLQIFLKISLPQLVKIQEGSNQTLLYPACKKMLNDAVHFADNLSLNWSDYCSIKYIHINEIEKAIQLWKNSMESAQMEITEELARKKYLEWIEACMDVQELTNACCLAKIMQEANPTSYDGFLKIAECVKKSPLKENLLKELQSCSNNLLDQIISDGIVIILERCGYEDAAAMDTSQS